MRFVVVYAQDDSLKCLRASLLVLYIVALNDLNAAFFFLFSSVEAVDSILQLYRRQHSVSTPVLPAEFVYI